MAVHAVGVSPLCHGRQSKSRREGPAVPGAGRRAPGLGNAAVLGTLSGDEMPSGTDGNPKRPETPTSLTHALSYFAPGAPEELETALTPRQMQTFTGTDHRSPGCGALPTKSGQQGAPGKGFAEVTFQWTRDYSEWAMGDGSPRTLQADGAGVKAPGLLYLAVWGQQGGRGATVKFARG